jgi:hypothetical protein
MRLLSTQLYVMYSMELKMRERIKRSQENDSKSVNIDGCIFEKNQQNNAIKIKYPKNNDRL